MKMLPWPVLRKAGSRWDHMMRLSDRHGAQTARCGHGKDVPRTVLDKRVVELLESALA